MSLSHPKKGHKESHGIGVYVKSIHICSSLSKARHFEVKDQVEALLVWLPNKGRWYFYLSVTIQVQQVSVKKNITV